MPEQLPLDGLDAPPIVVTAESIERLHNEVRFLAQMVAEVLDNLPVQRRPLSEFSKALHCRVIWHRRNGCCPCCQQHQVCDADGKLPGAEFDHYFSRHRNGAEETWLVCGACNRRLEDSGFKLASRSAFECYLHALRPFLVGRQDTLFPPTSAVA